MSARSGSGPGASAPQHALAPRRRAPGPRRAAGGRARAATVTALGLLVAAGAAEAREPALEYMLNCQGCHRADGVGTPGSIPPLVGSVARFLAVPGGREFLVQVPGVAQAQLDDATLAALVNWMLRRFDPAHLPARFVPYDAAEVGRLRRTPLTDVDGVRARLVRAFRADAAP